MATILIVEDRPRDRRLLATVLGVRGHHVVEASDGLDALEQARQCRPELIISDVLMPMIDGYEFVRRLRQCDDVGRTPVIFYTAYPVFPSGTDDPDVVGYMSKAVDRADLYALLPPAIRRSRERRESQT